MGQMVVYGLRAGGPRRLAARIRDILSILKSRAHMSPAPWQYGIRKHKHNRVEVSLLGLRLCGKDNHVYRRTEDIRGGGGAKGRGKRREPADSSPTDCHRWDKKK